MLLWMTGQRPYSLLADYIATKCVFKDSPAAQFDQIRALRPRFSSWTGTHRGVNDRTMRALTHRKTSGMTLLSVSTWWSSYITDHSRTVAGVRRSSLLRWLEQGFNHRDKNSHHMPEGGGLLILLGKASGR
ncbi:unnamed protein product [Leuciscus chuanchicus]